MEYTKILEGISFIKPEIAISILLLLVVIADLIFHQNKKFIPYLVLAGVFITGLLLFEQLGESGFSFIKNGDEYVKSYGMFAFDSFGFFFKIIILTSVVLLVLFSFSSEEIIKNSHRLGEYYALILGMTLGMFFMVSSADLILIYLSIELVSLSSYVLAGFTKLKSRNTEASLKYVIFGAVSSGLMLFGISLIYGLTGSTNLYILNSLIQGPNLNVISLSFSLLLIFAGMGYKISAAPFHFWTPDVYEGAPITITAFLSVASKAAGFALLLRFIITTFVSSISGSGYWLMSPIFDWKSFIIIISILTMTLGNFSALWQDNLKRMLAYSSIAHAGYILLGLAVLSNQGLLAIMIYFVFYLIMNLGAFYIVMLIANKTGSEDIDDYKGIGFTSPFLSISLAVFLVSLTGLPPTAGFIGKLYIFLALIDSNMITVAVIALLNTVVSLYYYVRVLKHMYLRDADNSTPSITPNYLNYGVILVLLIPILVFGIYFSPIVNFANFCIKIFGI